MQTISDPQQWQQWLAQAGHLLQTTVLVQSTLIQLGAVLLAGAFAGLAANHLRGLLGALGDRARDSAGMRKVIARAQALALAGTWLIIQWLILLGARALEWPSGLLTVTVNLLAAWVIIRLLSGFVRDPIFAKFISIAIWVIAALNILGWLERAIALLDGFAMSFGDLRISLLVVIKAVLSLAVLLWVATVVSEMFERRIKGSKDLTPSVQVLFSKLFQIVLIAIAFIAALSTVGIDLSAFAVLGGAIGVGIGFGLQKIVSNLISGIILLLDKSIKPGDVITVGVYYGVVNSLGARYVSVITRDGIEHLIPNEELITNRVENWSYSDSNIRLKVQIGVHYKADIHRALALCVEAAGEVPRVLKEPAPAGLLRGFGDSSVDLELRFWVNDPQNGRANVSSDVLLRIWDKFHEHGIEIPYPQRDLHLRTPSDIEGLLRSSRG